MPPAAISGIVIAARTCGTSAIVAANDECPCFVVVLPWLHACHAARHTEGRGYGRDLALARTLVVDATKVEDAVDDHTMELVVVGLAKLFGISASPGSSISTLRII